MLTNSQAGSQGNPATNGASPDFEALLEPLTPSAHARLNAMHAALDAALAANKLGPQHHRKDGEPWDSSIRKQGHHLLEGGR